ncbi:hypothetical protein BGX38DRAFT_1274402 [Terfezia claveryi]|nr:hypothetical protein BGX38DRAFT_1274402 [Terfezia claveryi]
MQLLTPGPTPGMELSSIFKKQLGGIKFVLEAKEKGLPRKRCIQEELVRVGKKEEKEESSFGEETGRNFRTSKLAELEEKQSKKQFLEKLAVSERGTEQLSNAFEVGWDQLQEVVY